MSKQPNSAPVRLQSNLPCQHEIRSRSRVSLTLPSSDPSSSKYGQYWSADDVHDMFAPPEDTVAAVKEWLTSSGIHGSRIVHSENKGWIAFEASVEEAEALLLAEFHEHEHTESANLRVGTDR